MEQKNVLTNNIPTPAYLLPDYPYQACGEIITDLKTLQSKDVLYDIHCSECGMSIRMQGDKVKHTYDRLTKVNGCIGCGNRNLTIRKIDISLDK